MAEPTTGSIDILVEFPPQAGLQSVALDPRTIAERSREALQHAFSTIDDLAAQLTSRVQQIAVRPNQVELSFGLKLTSEGHALIAKAGVEGTLQIKMVWANGG